MNQPEIEQIGEELYFVAASPATRRLRTQAELLSQTDVPVLITGESGSGKATAARLMPSFNPAPILSVFVCPISKVACALRRGRNCIKMVTDPARAEADNEHRKVV